MFTVNCGPPSPPPNCHIIESYTNTLEGAEVMFLCQDTFQFGQQSLCMEVNITTVCNKEGKWEPIADDINTCAGLRGLSGTIIITVTFFINNYFRYVCFWFTAHSLSKDGIIAIASSICIFILTSILFSLFGYLCRRNQEQKKSPSSANKPAPIYENVQIKNDTEMMDLETNVAYSPVQQQP